MIKKLPILSITTLSMFFIFHSPAINANTAEAFAACAKEEDSLKRLMCYDKASQEIKKDKVSETQVKDKIEIVQPKSEAKSAIYEGQTPTNSAKDHRPKIESQVNRDVLASEVKAEPVSSTKQTPAKSLEKIPSNAKKASENTITFNAEDAFGDEERVVRQSIDELMFTVASASKNPYKRWVLNFTNEQVWTQQDDNKYIKFSVGDNVTIKRGILGAFYLNDAAGDRRIRVKRIK